MFGRRAPVFLESDYLQNCQICFLFMVLWNDVFLSRLQSRSETYVLLFRRRRRRRPLAAA